MEFKIVLFDGNFREHLTEGDRYFVLDNEDNVRGVKVTDVETGRFDYDEETGKIRGYVKVVGDGVAASNVEFWLTRFVHPDNFSQKAYQQAEKGGFKTHDGKDYARLSSFPEILHIRNKEGLVMLVTPQFQSTLNYHLKTA